MKKIVLLSMNFFMIGFVFGQVLPAVPPRVSPPSNANPSFEQAANINHGLPPLCVACDPRFVKINISQGYNLQFLNDQSFNLGQTINVVTTPSKPIKSIKADLNYFEFLPESENCLACHNNSTTYGNFNSGSVTNTVGIGSGTHNLNFDFQPSKPSGNFHFNFNISLPPTVNCCEGIVRFCISYTIVFDDCTACTKLVCYERKKGSNIQSDHPNPNNDKSR